MKLSARLPAWSTIAPFVTWGILATPNAFFSTASWIYQLLVVLGLVIGILAAVFHAEVVAHRVGEPYGTLVLALAVTSIEVALIISLMIIGGESANE